MVGDITVILVDNDDNDLVIYEFDFSELWDNIVGAVQRGITNLETNAHVMLVTNHVYDPGTQLIYSVNHNNINDYLYVGAAVEGEGVKWSLNWGGSEPSRYV